MTKKISYILLATLTIGVLVSLKVLPNIIKNKVIQGLRQGCPDCEVRVGEMHFNLAGQVIVDNIFFRVSPSDPTQVELSCGQMVIDPKLMTIFSDIRVIDSIVIDRLKVQLTETFNENPPKPSAAELEKIEATYGGAFLESLPALTIGSIEISNSEFHYGMKKFGHEARLPITHIDAQISELGTRREISPRFINTDLTARLEESGSVIIKIQADLFSIKNQDRLDIEVKHQKMDELNSFFVFEDGITMGGLLKDARGDILLSQGKMTGHFTTEYQDLTLTMKPTPAHGFFKTVLSNIIQKTLIAKTKPSKSEPIPQIDVSYQRKPGESIIEFILDGLKESAMKATSH